MTLAQADTGREYVIKDIQGEDEELIRFLFTLGCYTGEPITVIARKRSSLVLAIKDARYNVDMDLAGTIIV